jgi:hypothetical protein
MAKEQFVRNKPHVNIGAKIKEKLFGIKAPEEPPIEPLDQAEVEAAGGDAAPGPEPQGIPTPYPVTTDTSSIEDGSAPDGGSMLLPRVGWEVSHDAADAGTPAEMSAEESDQAAMFNPKEFTISKPVPWGAGSGDDVDPAASADVPLMSAETETQHPDFMWLPASPSPGEAAEGDGQNDARFMQSRSGHLMDADEDNEALGAEEASSPDIQHDYVYQHNQTDLQFIKQPATEGAAADHQEGGQNNFVHQPPTHDDDADSLAAEDSDEAAGKVWMPSNFKLEVGGLDEGAGAPGSSFLPETDDQVIVGFEQGGQNAPVVVGGMWNGKDAPPGSEAGDADELGDSTLVGEFKVSESLVPLDAGEAPGFAELDVDGLDADLDD